MFLEDTTRGGEKGRKKRKEGRKGRGGVVEHRLQRSPAAAALTWLTSPTFPDDPTPQTSRRLSIHPPPHRRRANPVMRLSFPPPNSFLRECTAGSRILPSGSFVRRVLITHFERRDRNRALDRENEMFSYLSFSLSSRCLHGSTLLLSVATRCSFAEETHPYYYHIRATGRRGLLKRGSRSGLCRILACRVASLGY